MPFYHNNDEFDESIFYHQGNFFSRDNIKPGMFTLHPSGFHHGPHPKAFAAAAANNKGERKYTDEVAVMSQGKLVEIGSTAEVLRAPAHPYTRALLAAVPVPDPAEQRERRRAAGNLA